MESLREYIYNLYDGYGYRMLLGYIFNEAYATYEDEILGVIEPSDIKLDLDEEYFIKIRDDIEVPEEIELKFGSIVRVMNGVWIQDQSEEYLNELDSELESIFDVVRQFGN